MALRGIPRRAPRRSACPLGRWRPPGPLARAAPGAGPPRSRATWPAWSVPGGAPVGHYKILFYFDAFVHNSIIRLLPPAICTARTIAMLVYVYCAIYDAPPTPLLYAIHHTIFVMARSCKGQGVCKPNGAGLCGLFRAEYRYLSTYLSVYLSRSWVNPIYVYIYRDICIYISG